MGRWLSKPAMAEQAMIGIMQWLVHSLAPAGARGRSSSAGQGRTYMYLVNQVCLEAREFACSVVLATCAGSSMQLQSRMAEQAIVCHTNLWLLNMLPMLYRCLAEVTPVRPSHSQSRSPWSCSCRTSRTAHCARTPSWRNASSLQP
jgi:hypothetical protein